MPFPPVMRALPNWCHWVLLPSDRPRWRDDPQGYIRAMSQLICDLEKPAKVPVRPPRIPLVGWGKGYGLRSFDQVRADLSIWPEELFGGRGFVFFEEADLIFVDLDTCRDPKSGEITSALAREIIGLCAGRTWMEISQSGAGVHIIARRDGAIPAWVGNNGEGVEVYTRGRFVALTGNELPGSAEDVGAVPELIDLLRDRFPYMTSPAGGIADREIGQLEEGAVDVEEVEAALERISPDMGRNDWIGVIYGLKQGLPGEDGLDLALRWSRGDLHAAAPENYEGEKDDRAIETIWAEPWENRRAGGQASLISVFRRAGMSPPQIAVEALRAGVSALDDFGSVPLPEEQDPAQIEAERVSALEKRSALAERVREVMPIILDDLMPQMPERRVGMIPEFDGAEDVIATSQRLVADGHRVNLAVPGYAEAERISDALEAVGLSVVILRGRQARRSEDPRAPKMCARVELFQLGQDRALSSLGPGLCENPAAPKDRCPHWNGCPFIDQFLGVPAADVVIMTSARLLTEVGVTEARQWQAREMFFDDKPVVSIFALASALSVTAHEYLLNRKALDTVAGMTGLPAEMGDLAIRLRDWIDRHDTKDRQNAWPELRDDLGDALHALAQEARKAWTARRAAGVSPSETDAALRARLVQLKGHQVLDTFVALLHVIEKGGRGQIRLANGVIRFAPLMHINKGIARFGERQVTLVQDMHGATGDIVEAMLGLPPVLPGVAAEISAAWPIRYQITNTSFPASRFGPAAIEATCRRLDRLALACDLRFGLTAITTATKGKPDKLVHELHLPMNGNEPDAETLAPMQALAAMIVAGRIKIADQVAWLRAAALDHTLEDMPDESRASGNRHTRHITRPLVRMDGTSIDVPVAPELSRMIEAMQDNINGSQLSRVFNRVGFKDGRGVAFILSNVGCDVYRPHFTITEAELYGPKHMMELMQRFDWVLPLSPAWLVHHAGDVFETREAAKKFIRTIDAGPLRQRDEVTPDGIAFHENWLWREVQVEERPAVAPNAPHGTRAITCHASLAHARDLLLNLIR